VSSEIKRRLRAFLDTARARAAARPEADESRWTPEERERFAEIYAAYGPHDDDNMPFRS